MLQFGETQSDDDDDHEEDRTSARSSGSQSTSGLSLQSLPSNSKGAPRLFITPKVPAPTYPLLKGKGNKQGTSNSSTATDRDVQRMLEETNMAIDRVARKVKWCNCYPSCGCA